MCHVGRLTLTNYALYFESLGVGAYEKAVRYDLARDTKQVIKPDLTGPLGARLFDKAVMYKSTSTYVTCSIICDMSTYLTPELPFHFNFVLFFQNILTEQSLFILNSLNLK